MKRVVVFTAVALLGAACPTKPPTITPPPPIDECANLPPMTASALPLRVRVKGATTLSGGGGTGRYTYSISTNTSGGALSGDRYVAGPTPGVDTLTVSDDCANSANIDVDVVASFGVQPSRATIKPGTHLTIQVTGMLAAPEFKVNGTLPSGGSVSATGDYVAGPSEGVDLITVEDPTSGDQALVQLTVSLAARFRPTSPRLALPVGASVPIDSLDGSGAVTWKVVSGPGRVDALTYWATDAGPGDVATLEGADQFTQEKTEVKIRVLTELSRPNRPQGRRSDVATSITGDFDGDGFRDLAVGFQESDLAKPQGGAVFIYRGGASGLSAQPSWTILGASDTANLGAVMAAGDLDGDGKDDLAISAPGADITVADSGAVFLYKITADGPQLLRPPLTGLGAARFGSSLAIADVDQDGDNDLLVGSPTADLSTGNQRGVLDIFVLQKGQPIPEAGAIRIGGVDLNVDGTLKTNSTGLRAARGLIAADLNDDGKIDLALLSAVNNSLLNGTALAKAQIAVQVHLSRGTAGQPFNATPDLFVLPTNPADSNEGNWRLGFVPKTASSPPMLLTAADLADSPNLSADGGTSGGTNAGGALLFDLTAQKPTGAAPTSPLQLGPTNAFAKVYGDQPNINAGRSFAATDLDQDGKLELILGAPYATNSVVDGGTTVNTPLAGKLLVYPLGTYSPGTVVNKPTMARPGQARADVLGTTLTTWSYTSGATALVTVAGRASTDLGDFTGRIDAFTGTGNLASWAVTSSPIANKPASQLFGAAIDLAPVAGVLRVAVGSPGVSGPAPDNSGNDVDAGQALLFSAPDFADPRVVAEGTSNAPYLRDGGWVAFGGRGVGVDVAMTDFNGDGLPDLAIAAPNFTPPTRLADGGTSVPDYAVNRPECLTAAAQSPGGAFIHLGRSDGTFKEAYRVWVPRDVIGADGGVAYQRTQLGRQGLVGGFDFNGDKTQDLLVTRGNGLEIFAGRPPDDLGLAKVTMACDSLLSLPALGTNQYGTAPAALGDLNGDGCDEVGIRYTDNNTRSGVIIAFGYGSACDQTTASWLRISGDTETGLTNLRLGTALARAGQIMANDARDFVAITADLFSYNGSSQATILLFDVAELVAKRPASGERLVAALGDGLTPVPTVYFERCPGLGRMLASGDVNGDGKPDLIVGATGANTNGDGTGAVFVFTAGSMVPGPNTPYLTVVSDQRERAAFGQDLAISPKSGVVPATLGIGAPQSYRSGTANGTAYLLPLDF